MKPSDVLNLLGLNTTILRIAPSEKRPIAKEWQKLRPSDMTPDYLASFAAGEGIRVSLDEASWSAGSTNAKCEPPWSERSSFTRRARRQRRVSKKPLLSPRQWGGIGAEA